jgi:hypothetical protein
MFRKIYLFFVVTSVSCLIVKFIYHRYKKVKPFPDKTFIIPGAGGFLSLIYIFCPIKYDPNSNPKENRIRKFLNYWLFYYYVVVIVLTIGGSHFDKIVEEETPKKSTTIIDSSTIIKPLSDSEKAAIKDSFDLEIKKPPL